MGTTTTMTKTKHPLEEVLCVDYCKSIVFGMITLLEVNQTQ
jgi:hypothetical protein